MNKNVQIILSFMLAIGLSNPFIEFDKSFLYNNNSDEEKLEDLNHNTKECIHYINSFDSVSSSDPGFEYLKKNPMNTVNVCSCLFEELSEQKIVDLKNFLITISVSSLKENWDQKKIESDWENIKDSLSCLIEIDEEINKQYTFDDLFAILYYTLSSNIEIDKEIETKVSEQLSNIPKSETKDQTSQKSKPDKNSFEEKIKDYTKIEGLFTFYSKEEENTILMEIKLDQLETIYLASFTRQSGDAHWFDGSSMMGEFPIMFKKVGNKIQAIEVNVKFRADNNLAINKAVESHISNSIMASTKIIASPHKETGSYLIDASNFFISIPQTKYLNAILDKISKKIRISNE